MTLTTGERIKRVTRILKQRFTNMTVDETIDLAVAILNELDKPERP